jgi:hypothetical protein
MDKLKRVIAITRSGKAYFSSKIINADLQPNKHDGQ